jgi:hypothetical protein
MVKMRALLISVFLFAISGSLDANGNPLPHIRSVEPAKQQTAAPSTPLPANPTDVRSPDAILAAIYDVISGPAGQKRDWNRFLSLFAPDARLIPIAASKEGGFHSAAMTPDQYVTHGESYFTANGFFEREIARRREQWGNILQVFSTYESRHTAADATPFARGINSFQLFFDGKRWWIVTIMWQGESASTPLTPEFLPSQH